MSLTEQGARELMLLVSRHTASGHRPLEVGVRVREAIPQQGVEAAEFASAGLSRAESDSANLARTKRTSGTSYF
ncbi:hypothetical protein PR003_g14159 [Phytophthora rubi]|uniref:Uncharacterized protein n=1 Tax=Phytophthora rubi TaxID=129364 RepID=A0A6A4EVJ4_9STRA|nr:hypothetical protein PR003_g14159 [Phytophthora rubi]